MRGRAQCGLRGRSQGLRWGSDYHPRTTAVPPGSTYPWTLFFLFFPLVLGNRRLRVLAQPIAYWVWPRRVASAHPSFDPKILHPDFFVVWPFFLKCPDAQFHRAGNRCLHFWGVFSFNLAEGRTLACPAPLDCPFPSAAFQPQEPGNEATLAFSVGRRCTQSSRTTWRQCKDFSKGIVDSSAWLISGGVAACTTSRVAGEAYIPVCKSCVSLALELVTMIPHSSVLGMLRAACL